MGMGTALYMSAGVGQGPRDNLMVALIRITKKRVALVRSSLEYSALFAGYLCGGPVGLGTLVHALLMGIFVESGFRLIQRLEETPLRGVVRVPVGRFTPKADRPGTPGGQSSVV